MTKAQISKRISEFEAAVNRHAKKITEIGNASWDPIKETTETQTVRAFQTKRNAGVDYLNRNLAKLLSKNGRVVKFAGLFLHGTPMVTGWTTTKAGRKRRNRNCELADLMTVFLYLDAGNDIKRMRCVMFQAKMQQSKGAHVVDDPEQRKLYDECEGFDYVHGTVAKAGEERRLPKGASRKKALQFMFVEPRPAETRTIPSDKGKARSQPYGNHLVRFLNGKTGLNASSRKSEWGKVVWELMEGVAESLYSDKKIRGKGIKGLLKHFNSFEKHDVWCIDEGQADEGFGVQLMIVWDGDIPAADPQTIMPPMIPVKKVKVEVVPEDDEELENQIAIEEEEMIAMNLT